MEPQGDHTLPRSDFDDAYRTLLALFTARTYLFTLFHKVFGGFPTKELLKAITSPFVLDALDEYAEATDTPKKLREHLASLADTLNEKSVLWDIEAEYTRAFVGPSSLPATPWRAPYISREASLMQADTLATRNLYRSHGLEPKACRHVPDDHISLLCAFAAIEAQKALDALRVRNWKTLRALMDEQCAFDRDYLVLWLPEYASRMCHMKTAFLYPQLAKAAAAFAEQDQILCAEVLLWIDDCDEVLRTASPILELPKSISDALNNLEALQAIKTRGLEENELRMID